MVEYGLLSLLHAFVEYVFRKINYFCVNIRVLIFDVFKTKLEDVN